MAYTLLTGATGLIGRYLLRDLSPHSQMAVMLRENERESASERFDNLVASLDDISSQGEKPEKDLRLNSRVIPGDLLNPDLRLSKSDRDWIRKNVNSVVHCAGNVSFEKNFMGEGPLVTNVEGTRYLAEFCKSVGIEDFSYVSTSFVCGDRQSTIYENELDCGQQFDSEYEESKFQAEQLLHGLDFANLKIFRPCSVTGDSLTGQSSTFHGVYWFAQFTSLARSRAQASKDMSKSWLHDVRIFKSGRERHHLIPVDLLSRAVAELHRNADAAGTTFHLTPHKACTLAQLENALSQYYHYHGVTFCDADCVPREDLNSMEQLFYDGLQSIGHRYLDGDPVFDCSNTLRLLPWWQDIQVDHQYLVKVFQFAEEQGFGRRKRKKRSTVRDQAGLKDGTTPDSQSRMWSMLDV